MSIIITKNGQNAKKLDKSGFENETSLQEYIHNNPETIPLYEIDEDIQLLVLVREFPTQSGPIDAIGIDKDGNIYIIETKLFKNPDKRTVIAQMLDYGASLWTHSSDFNDFSERINRDIESKLNTTLTQRIQDFFKISEEDTLDVLDSLRRNLSDGIIKFIVLMDQLDDRLKDLILYVNQNSQFDIYAVELEYYKYQSNEIIIPKIYGAEVKKDLSTKVNSKKTQWNWELFSKKLAEHGRKSVVAAKAIIDWASQNQIKIDWSENISGSFIMCFFTKDNQGYYPISVFGNATVSWNDPHQGEYSPKPFNKPEMKAELLKRLGEIEGVTSDPDNVHKYSALQFPLEILEDEATRNQFFSVCSWINQQLKQN